MHDIPQWESPRRAGPVDGRQLGELILASQGAAENYRDLARCFQGWQREALQTLAREARAQRACLAGIRHLVTGEDGKVPAVQPDTGPIPIRLKKAYLRAMRLLTACDAHTAEAEYGPVFQRLAQRQQDHCRKLLEIIGSLQQMKNGKQN